MGRGWETSPLATLSMTLWFSTRGSLEGKDLFTVTVEGAAFSCMARGWRVISYVVGKYRWGKKLQKEETITVHSFLPTLLFPYSPSLTWRKNVHKHYPSRMVSGFVDKARPQVLLTLASFSTWGHCPSWAGQFTSVWAVSFPLFPWVFKENYTLPSCLCNKNFIEQLHGHGAAFWLLRALEGWPLHAQKLCQITPPCLADLCWLPLVQGLKQVIACAWAQSGG